MKLLLLKPARIRHEAGDTVQVSPAEAAFLVSVGAAKPLEAAAEEAPAKKPVKKK